LLEKKLIPYSQLALKREDFKKTEDVFNRVMNRDNIAVACLLRHKEDGYRLIVANAHFHWDPAYSDVKLVQIGMLMDELDDLATKWSKRKDDKTSTFEKIPLVICVDTNSMPDSGVYEYVSKGVIDGNHPDFKNHRYGKYTDSGMSHPFNLRSAYGQGPGGKEILPFTNYTPGFVGVIDYIWYETPLLNVEAVMDGPEAAYVENVVGFPDPHFPSEYHPYQGFANSSHIVIAAKLRIKDSSSTDKKKGSSAID
jgi:CCR4-NOT transcription complex subunit 6